MRIRTQFLATLAVVGLPCLALAQPPAAERLRETFEKLDANQDKILERSEIPEAGLAAFDRLAKRGDTNGDGKLDVEELRGLGQKVRSLTGDAANAGRARIAAMDQNGDGELTREEFRGPPAVFDRLDTDKDGILKPKEIRAGAGGAAGAGAAAPGGGRLKAMDSNDDGKVSREEFRGPAALFDRLDTDKNGVIDGSEQKAAARGAAARIKPANAKKKAAKGSPARKPSAAVDSDS